MNVWDVVAIVAVLLIGVPHGGLDGAVARRVGWPPGLISWLAFHLAYVALAIVVVVLWSWFPLHSLSAFLIISALHFGASDITDTGFQWLPLLAHGGFVSIAIPSLQAAAVEPVFAILVGESNASIIMSGITYLLIPWILSVTGYVVYAFFNIQYRKSLLSLMVLIGLASVLPPLISFAFYFCLWHSRGHLLRLWRSLDESDRSRNLREAATYTVAAWASLAVVFYLLRDTAETSLVQSTFIGLAALTLPHMLLVDYADRKNQKRELLL